eukprot:scaffold1806_cov240-Pinguiococcus_pyrenoidosus.AAC.27
MHVRHGSAVSPTTMARQATVPPATAAPRLASGFRRRSGVVEATSRVTALGITRVPDHKEIGVVTRARMRLAASAPEGDRRASRWKLRKPRK